MRLLFAALRISIHALREEGDSFSLRLRLCALQFLSTPSVRRATVWTSTSWPMCAFLSTPSVRRATSTACRGCINCKISIHALREEGDYTPFLYFFFRTSFLSTPSVRRATLCRLCLRSGCTFLSTPSVRRATILSSSLGRQPQISIHALREEGDDIVQLLVHQFRLFLSTPSVRRATWRCRRVKALERISIHALREEGDDAFVSQELFRRYFYPRPP